MGGRHRTLPWASLAFSKPILIHLVMAREYILRVGGGTPVREGDLHMFRLRCPVERGPAVEARAASPSSIESICSASRLLTFLEMECCLVFRSLRTHCFMTSVQATSTLSDHAFTAAGSLLASSGVSSPIGTGMSAFSAAFRTSAQAVTASSRSSVEGWPRRRLARRPLASLWSLVRGGGSKGCPCGASLTVFRSGHRSTM